MKKKITMIGWTLAVALCGFLTVQCGSGAACGDEDFSVTVHLQEERQVIDGFGVSEADWADDVFIFPKRDEVLARLFGEDGLRLNILRGEIFPHYSPDPETFDFAIDSDISEQAVALAPQMERNDLLRRGQYWLSHYVAHAYPQVDFMFTAWSPPAWMKEGGHATELYPASHGSLMKSHYQSYADYLALFYQKFQEQGIRIKAISPSNEPGYAAPWNSCLWTPEQMGEFVHDYLLPTFRKNHIDAKVIVGENPSWSVTSEHFHNISSQRFVNALLKAYPDLTSEEVIAGGHGYELPSYLPLPLEARLNPIVPFEEAAAREVHMWVTEMSNIDPLTLTMKDGLHWASVFSDYLTDGQVSAILWWLGAQPTKTNESLIVLDNESGTYAEAKRFDVMGNFSRYITPGSICVGRSFESAYKSEEKLPTQAITSQLTSQTSLQHPELPEGVKVATFKNGRSYTVVIVNPRDEEITCSLALDGGRAKSDLRSYTTDADHQWQESTVRKEHGRYLLTLPVESVVTLVGEFR